MSCDWIDTVLSEVINFNPKEELKKGVPAKKIAMEELQPFAKKITGFIMSEYSGGAKFRNGDTLLARITPCLENGKTAYVDILEQEEIAFGSTEFIVMRAKPGITDEAFIYYLASAPAFRAVAIQSMTGTSGRQRVQNSLLENAVFRIPTLPEQRAIASTLSALDDKIELNNRINKTLEEMAQALFKRWFVDFEFPDENGLPYKSSGGKMEESELGLIPKGWTIGQILDCCVQVQNGGTPLRSEVLYWNPAEIPWLTSGEVRKKIITETENAISQLGLEKSSAKWLDEGATVVALYGATAGQVAFVAARITTNQAVCGLTPKKFFRYFNFLMLIKNVDLLANSASGSAQQNISKGIVETTRTIIPLLDIAKKFEQLCEPIFSKWIHNIIENNYLTSIRDALLPKLMSGEIRVPIEEVAIDV